MVTPFLRHVSHYSKIFHPCQIIRSAIFVYFAQVSFSFLENSPLKTAFFRLFQAFKKCPFVRCVKITELLQSVTILCKTMKNIPESIKITIFIPLA